MLHRLLFGLSLCMGIMGCHHQVENGDISDPQLDSLLLKGISKTRELQFDQAHEYLTTVMNLAEAGNKSRYLILANLNMGGLYHHFGSQDEALRYFFQSLELAQKYGQDDLLNSIYNNIGIIYMQNKSYEKALEYYTQALEISRQREQEWRVGTNLVNMGSTLDALGRTADALRAFEEAQAIFRNVNDSINLGATINNTGSIYFDQHDYAIALKHYRDAYALSSTSTQPWYRWEYSLNLGKCYYQFDALDSARYYIDQAEVGFRSTDNTEMLIEAYSWKSRIERARGDFENALHFAEIALAHKDSLLEEKAAKWVSELQMNFEFGKKETELELMRELAQRRQFLWIGTVIAGIIFAVLLIITMRTTNQNLRQKNVILEQEQAVTQLNIEKNQAQQEQLRQEMIAKERLNTLEQESLRQKIAFRDRELVGKALHLVNKNEMFSALQEVLSTYKKQSEADRERVIREALNLLKSAQNMDQDWAAFKIHFEEVHPNFFSGLHHRYPELSSGDLRMCAYLRLDLTAKEIAQIFNISPDSVRKRKQRLREKLGLGAEEDLGDWLRR